MRAQAQEVKPSRGRREKETVSSEGDIPSATPCRDQVPGAVFLRVGKPGSKPQRRPWLGASAGSNPTAVVGRQYDAQERWWCGFGQRPDAPGPLLRAPHGMPADGSFLVPALGNSGGPSRPDRWATKVIATMMDDFNRDVGAHSNRATTQLAVVFGRARDEGPRASLQ